MASIGWYLRITSCLGGLEAFVVLMVDMDETESLRCLDFWPQNIITFELQFTEPMDVLS